MPQYTLDDINRMDRSAFLAALGGAFEHSPWVAEIACAQRPFPSLKALHETLAQAVRNAGSERQRGLIREHPDLAGKAAREGTLTPNSTREQAAAGLDRLSDAEFSALERLNSSYRAKFDMPFIVCVRRHGRESILRQFERRLAHDALTEHEAALDEIIRIAALRLDQLVAASDRLKVNGRLSTHVLDLDRGRPAAGVDVELCEVFSSGEFRSLLRLTTNDDGRTDRPLIADQPIPIAQYELRFAVGPYFIGQQTSVADPPFLDVVPVRFAVAEPEGHYHVPLLVTPWSYSTYRGS
jgi:2-oxo-4-hydroxy-4-carboxy-5-ureidoimidazoline decarboxylase